MGALVHGRAKPHWRDNMTRDTLTDLAALIMIFSISYVLYCVLP